MIIKPSRYVLVFGLTMLAIIALIFAISFVFEASFGTVWAPLVPAVVASMIEGRGYARQTTQEISNGEAWKAAVQMTAVALGLYLMLAAFILQAQPEIMGVVMAQPLLALGGVAMFCLLWLVTNRFFFTLGIKNERATGARN